MSLRAVFASCALLVTAIAAIGCAEGQDETIRISGPVMIERGEY